MQLTTYQRRKLKAAGWIEDQFRLFWQDPVSGNYFAPAMAWVMLKRRLQ
jgi:hypothetical protein